MVLLTRVKIEGFRSFLTNELTNLGNFVALVGKNSSGKSNVLRALNLFFNDEVQTGQKLSFPRDLFLQPHKKKRVSITVDFKLPPTFVFKEKVKHLRALGKQFSITRVWEHSQLNIINRYEIDAPGLTDPNLGDLASQFLSLIKFRYIPNRTVPTDILRNESQSLIGSVFQRMKNQTHANALMSELTAAAGRMLEDASNSMNRVDSPLKNPTAATNQLNQMLLMSGFQARGDHGGIVQDAEWGAGHQAFFLYQVLCTIDTDYSRFFGWRQATIWAVEEPESALHRDLESSLASQFRVWTQDSKRRLQIILTTHSPVFTMAADSGCWVAIENSSSKLRPMSIQRLAKAAETEGVIGWTHPILSHPWNPVVLVEGTDDAEVLTYVASLAGYDHLRFVALPTLDGSEPSGGKDSIVTYLKRYQGLTGNRSPEAPLMVLFDWDVSSNEVGKARKAYGLGGVDRVFSMNPQYCDSLMSSDFKGIERFYPPRVILEAHNAGELVLGIASGKPYSISKAQLEPAKSNLLRRLKQTTNPSELLPLAKVLKDIEVWIASYFEPQRAMFKDNPSA